MTIENPIEEKLRVLSIRKNKIEFQIIHLQQKLSVSIVESAKENDKDGWEEDKEQRFKEAIKLNPVHQEIVNLKETILKTTKELEELDKEYNTLNEKILQNIEIWNSPISSLSLD